MKKSNTSTSYTAYTIMRAKFREELEAKCKAKIKNQLRKDLEQKHTELQQQQLSTLFVGESVATHWLSSLANAISDQTSHKSKSSQNKRVQKGLKKQSYLKQAMHLYAVYKKSKDQRYLKLSDIYLRRAL